MSRLGLLALLAFALQFIVLYTAAGDRELTARGLFYLSYLLLLVFVAFNWRRLGIAIIGAGLLLNLLAIASNGGFMPVSPQTLVRAGLEEAASEHRVGDSITTPVSIVREKDDTRLQPLTDTLVLKNPSDLRVFSIGDVLIGAGLVITLGELFLPRVQRVSGDRPSLT